MRGTILLVILALAAENPTHAGAAPLPVTKSRHQWSLAWKSFRLDDGETISLYGVKRRRFFAPSGEAWYWGEAGYGAVTGERGGYFEGGGMIGYQHSLWRLFVVDLRLFSGAGGGGNVAEGGGWIVQPVAGLGARWTPRIHTVAEAGYGAFINGDIRGWTMSIALNCAFWDLQ